MMTIPQTAEEILNECYLEVRAKLIEVAAALDRIGRADSAGEVRDDPRLHQIRDAIAILNIDHFDRAERLQLLFSDQYDAGWNE